jgi:hypothetical protein
LFGIAFARYAFHHPPIHSRLQIQIDSRDFETKCEAWNLHPNYRN